MNARTITREISMKGQTDFVYQHTLSEGKFSVMSLVTFFVGTTQCKEQGQYLLATSRNNKGKQIKITKK